LIIRCNAWRSAADSVFSNAVTASQITAHWGRPEQPGHGVELTLGVAGTIYLAHAAFADLGGDRVGAEGGAGLKWH
jgi:N-formylglutamate amidohydrolase